ncbi:MAG: PA0069 family radical SAM protein [Steroidobacteraceae bacterium]
MVDWAIHENRKPMQYVRVRGGLAQNLRFFRLFDPSTRRKRNIAGAALKARANLRVAAMEALPGRRELFDISTGTGDFIANGVVSHNCYARPTHAWLGLSPGLDFETKLYFKAHAAGRLRRELGKPGYVPRLIMLGANTDPYQPVEKRLKVTRSILETLQTYRHPVSIVTKGALIERDLDILSSMARDRLASVMVSLTTLDPDLKRRLEPRAASPPARLSVIRRLHEAGVPVGALIAPVIPALTDHELERLLEAAARAGARCAGYVVLRLPLEVKDLFRDWLLAHYPDRAQHVMSRVHSIRDGRDNDPRFGSRMKGSGVDAALLKQRFEVATRRLGLESRMGFDLDTTLFRSPGNPTPQLPLL